MKLDIEYVDLEHCLRHLKRQVQDSMPYVHKFVPNTIRDPEELYYYLRSKVFYKKDPVEIIDGKKVDVEYIQTVQTLLGKNKGEGDCDCFTVLTLASCAYLDFWPMYVNLVGNGTISPTHIYSSVFDQDQGKVCAMDLTNTEYDFERSYKYRQRLNFIL